MVEDFYGDTLSDPPVGTPSKMRTAAEYATAKKIWNGL